ncbi:MAG: AhpC/TSA family protein [Coprobacter sp.]|nr:AhpC/TSA family protein [Coprobacter sp.]
MKYINFIFLLSGLLALVACSKPYTITVDCVSHATDTTTVYLKDYFTGDLIDSVSVKEGKAVFTGDIRAGKIARVVIGENTATIVLEPGDIQVAFNAVIPLFYEISGTSLNDSLNYIQGKDVTFQVGSMFKILSLKDDADMERKRDSIMAATNDSLRVLYKNNTSLYEGTPIGELCVVEWMRKTIGTDEFSEARTYLPRSIKNTEPVQKLIATDKGVRANRPGSMFVDFTIENGNIDGSSVSLSDYVGKGKYVLVDFWASWCAPCRAGIPAIKELYEEYAGENFDVVSVAVNDGRNATLKALEKEQMPWHQIIDAQDIPMRLYGFTAIPQVMLFAPDGTLVARDLHGDAVREAVEKALGK